MRFFNKLSYLFALPFTITSFILMLSSDAILMTFKKNDIRFSGTDVVFGWHQNGTSIYTYPSPLAKAAWIIGLVAIIIMLFGLVLRFIYGDELQKFHIFLNIILIAGLITAGIFTFLVIPTFFEANDMGVFVDDAIIGNGWGVAASFYLVSALIIAFPLVFNTVKRK